VVDVEALKRQVQFNCEVTNARHAGTYSVCGLLLRLRNLYKWEQALPPWEEPDPAAALAWVERKEQSWECLADEEFEPLALGRARLDPLEAEAINRQLSGTGLVYGAGYGWGLKPTFFLGRLSGRRRVLGRAVQWVGQELARDLFSSPAMLLGERVVVRSDAAAYYLWDRIHDVKKSGQAALLVALEAWGLGGRDLTPAVLKDVFPRIVAAELETYARHETGELLAEGFPRQVWRAIIARFPGERVELVARAVKDALADTGPRGMLAYIIRGKRLASLGFYVAFLDGVRRLLLPGIRPAFERFRRDGHWPGIEAARAQAYAAALEMAAALTDIFGQLKERGEEWVRAEAEERLIKPLGM